VSVTLPIIRPLASSEVVGLSFATPTANAAAGGQKQQKKAPGSPGAFGVIKH